MKSAYPPLNALRVFQVAARYGSFALAAQSLYLTPAAVAYQIKQLEDYLGFALFERKPRGVALTQAGVDYWQATAGCLKKLSEETSRLINDYSQQDAAINLYTLHAIAEKWLLPRLAGYQSDGSINLVAMTSISPEASQEGDISISFQTMPDSDRVIARPLMAESVFPVCSPDYLRQFPHALDLGRLHEHVWLYDVDWEQDWVLWQTQKQQDRLRPSKRLNFSLYSLVVDAAVNGMGVAMGRQQLIRAELAAGKLVALSSQAVQMPQVYCLLVNPEKLHKPPIRQLFDWLLLQGGLSGDK